MNHTAESIKALLDRNDKAVARALVVLYNNQTFAEQSTEHTLVHNNKGFTGADARLGTSMAKQYLTRGFLSPKQIAIWRRLNKKGVSKIGKYTRQLIEAIPPKQEVAA